MPFDFPDMDSLKMAAEVHKFRQPHVGESEHIFRIALSNHVRPFDFIESCEIRFGVGCDRWNKSQIIEHLSLICPKED